MASFKLVAFFIVIFAACAAARRLETFALTDEELEGLAEYSGQYRVARRAPHQDQLEYESSEEYLPRQSRRRIHHGRSGSGRSMSSVPDPVIEIGPISGRSVSPDLGPTGRKADTFNWNINTGSKKSKKKGKGKKGKGKKGKKAKAAADDEESAAATEAPEEEAESPEAPEEDGEEEGEEDADEAENKEK